MSFNAGLAEGSFFFMRAHEASTHNAMFYLFRTNSEVIALEVSER
jgi:hypothetical protein